MFYNNNFVVERQEFLCFSHIRTFLSVTYVIIFTFFAVFRKIWASRPLEQHDDLCWGPMRSIKVITRAIFL